MTNAKCSALIVTGINTGADEEPIELAHHRAIELLGLEWVSPLSPVTNGFHQSFAVFPSGSPEGRESSERHTLGLNQLIEHLADTDLDYVRVAWGNSEAPAVTGSHEDREQLALRLG